MATAGKVITCRAAVINAPYEPFVIESVQVAPPKAGEIRVKMVSSGIYHSNVHLSQRDIHVMGYPMVLGLEGAGIVESVGTGVKEMEPGDIVIPLIDSYCGECRYCRNPKGYMCERQLSSGKQSDGTSRIFRKGQPLTQMRTISTFSEYTVMPEINAVKVNPKAPVNRLCLAGFCIPTAYGAVMNRAQVSAGSTCAVWGLGGVGLTVVLACKECKAAKIIGVDLNPKKFPLAKEFGCTDVINPKDVGDVPAALSKMTDGGVDYCFVSVGVASAMEEAFLSSDPIWGETIIIGMTEMGKKLQLDVIQLLYGKQLKGTYFGTYKGKLEIPGIVDKILDGKIPLEKLITRVIPLEDINEGFKMPKTDGSIRTIIDFDLKKN